MYENDIPGGCYATIAVIERDGWTQGAGGWINMAGTGWCLEGALGQALGIPLSAYDGHFDRNWRERLLKHPVAVAIQQVVYERHGSITLFDWNDRVDHNKKKGKQEVLRLLREVAALHTPQPPRGRQIGCIGRIKAFWVRAGEPKPEMVLTTEAEPVAEQVKEPVSV